MINIFDSKIKGDLHSLYLIDDSSSNAIQSFLDFLENRSIKVLNNINIVQEEYNSFGIDTSRNIIKLHNEKNNEDAKIFILKVKYFTNEAQHALLKLFEDTNTKNHFFIFSESVNNMIDTIQSRAVFINIKDYKKKNQQGRQFLMENKNDRLKTVASIIKKHKDDKDSASLRNEARDIVNSLELFLYENDKGVRKKENIWKFNEIIKARKYLSTPGASVKMILEHLALVL